MSLFCLYFGLLLAALPIFTTGEWEPPRGAGRAVGRFLQGMLPHAMFRAELPSGTPLMGLWLALAGGLIAAGFVVMGSLGSFPGGVLLALFVLAVAAVAAFIAWGNYLSIAFKDRKATMVLAYLTIAALSLLPFFGYLTWQASDRTGPARLSWQFLYLTPFMAFVEMGDSSRSFWTNNPPMLLGQTPFWQVTAAIYAGLAVLLFTLTLNRIRREADQKPAEEQTARQPVGAVGGG